MGEFNNLMQQKINFMKKGIFIFLIILIISIVFYEITNFREYGYSEKSPNGKFTIEIYSTKNLIINTFYSFIKTGNAHGGSGWTKAYAILLDKNGNELGNTGCQEFFINEIEIYWDLPDEVYIRGAGSFDLKTGEFN